jgi:putative transposase
MVAPYTMTSWPWSGIGTAHLIPVTNAVESLNRVIRKAIKTRGSFPSEQAAEKLIYLAIRGHEKTSRTVRGWLTAVNQFVIMFEERFSPMPG